MEISLHSLLMETSLHVSWERDGQGVGEGGGVWGVGEGGETAGRGGEGDTRPEMGMKTRKGSVLCSFGEDTGAVGSQCYPSEKGTFWDFGIQCEEGLAPWPYCMPLPDCS